MLNQMQAPSLKPSLNVPNTFPGVVTKYSRKSAWRIKNASFQEAASFAPQGCVQFIVGNHVGLPLPNIEVLVAWDDNLMITTTNASGRARLHLMRLIQKHNIGNQWAGLVEEGAPEVHGLGIQMKKKVVYTIAYTCIRA